MSQLAASPPPFHPAATPFAHPSAPGQQHPPHAHAQFYPSAFAGQGGGYGGSDGANARSSTPAAGTLHGQPPNYSSAPSHSVPPQQQHPHLRPGASPPAQQHQQQQQQQQQRRPSPPNAGPRHPTPSATKQYPMAAPPLPNTPSSATGPAGAGSSPKTPLSPASESREQQRIAHLLTLNGALLSEISVLQAAGQGGALNPAQAETARQKGLPDKLASEDYIHTMRRVQANLQYLMYKQQPDGGAKQLPGPAVMTPPPHLGDKLREEYERLRELFPGWNGIESRGGLGTPGRQNSAGGQGLPQPQQTQPQGMQQG